MYIWTEQSHIPTCKNLENDFPKFVLTGTRQIPCIFSVFSRNSSFNEWKVLNEIQEPCRTHLYMSFVDIQIMHACSLRKLVVLICDDTNDGRLECVHDIHSNTSPEKNGTNKTARTKTIKIIATNYYKPWTETRTNF